MWKSFSKMPGFSQEEARASWVTNASRLKPDLRDNQVGIKKEDRLTASLIQTICEHCRVLCLFDITG